MQIRHCAPHAAFQHSRNVIHRCSNELPVNNSIATSEPSSNLDLATRALHVVQARSETDPGTNEQYTGDSPHHKDTELAGDSAAGCAPASSRVISLDEQPRVGWASGRHACSARALKGTGAEAAAVAAGPFISLQGREGQRRWLQCMGEDDMRADSIRLKG